MANPGSQQAVDEASQLGDIGFPEFTAKLVNDTFNAMVSSMIHQEQSYADLLEKVAMTLDDFAAEAVQESDILTWISEHIGKHGGTDPVSAYKNEKEFSQDQVGDLITSAQETVSNDKIQNFLPSGAVSTSGQNNQLSAGGKIDLSNNKQGVTKLIRHVIGKPRMNALERLVEQGVVRIAVDDGTIHTDLDFHTSGSDTQRESSSHSEHNTTSAEFGGSFIGEMFGIEGGARTKNVYVSTRHSQQTAEASSDVDIQGHVKVNFRGDYKPLGNPPSNNDNS